VRTEQRQVKVTPRALSGEARDTVVRVVPDIAAEKKRGSCKRRKHANLMRSQEVVRVLEEPSSETLPRTPNFAFVVLQNHPQLPLGALASKAAMPSRRSKDHRTNWQEKGTTTCTPLALARKEPGRGAYIGHFTSLGSPQNGHVTPCGTSFALLYAPDTVKVFLQDLDVQVMIFSYAPHNVAKGEALPPCRRLQSLGIFTTLAA
jgi:hypothetical protein